MSVRVEVSEDIVARRIGVWVLEDHPDGSTSVLRDGEWFEVDDAAFSPPTLRLSPELAMELAGKLEAIGVRPPERSFTEGRLASMERHLADLRTLIGLEPRGDGVYVPDASDQHVHHHHHGGDEP